MQSIGERLEEARKRKGISIREAAEATKIRGEYLHKFESNQYDIKLPEIYVRGFLRTYSNYLKLPAEKIINDYLALGLGEPKTRTLSREVYGRMDLTVSTAKDKAAEPAPANTDTTAPIDTGHRNPATFVPQGGANSIDQGALIKLSLIGIALIALIILGVWGVISLTSTSTPVATKPTPAPVASEIWSKPQPGETTLGLIAYGTVKITVISADSKAVLFQGTLLSTESRDIPRRGKLTITSDNPQFLKIRIGSTEYELKDRTTGAFLTSANIDAPAAR